MNAQTLPGTTVAMNRIQDAYAPYSLRLLDVMLDDYLDEAVAYLERTGRGIPPHSPTPVPVLTVSGAADAKNSK